MQFLVPARLAKQSVSFLTVLSLLAFCFVTIPISFAETYFAHAERTAESELNHNATLLFTGELATLANLYDSSDLETRENILSKLLTVSSVSQIFKLNTPKGAESALESSEELENSQLIKSNLEARLKNWQAQLPLFSQGPKISGMTASLSTEQLLIATVDLIKLNSQLMGFRNALSTDMRLFPTRSSAHSKKTKLEVGLQAVKTICQAPDDSDDTIDSLDLPNWSKAALAIQRHLPVSINLRMSGWVLGTEKTCNTLANDVLSIVDPHQSEQSGSRFQPGQLEGTSRFLTERVFAISDNELLISLMALETVSKLDSEKTEGFAMISALAHSSARLIIKPLNLVRLMNLAAHNHSVEYYVMKAALYDGLSQGPLTEQNSTQLALRAKLLFYRINHLYQLLATHRTERREFAKEDLLAHSERPYHYWGGALLSCELVEKGYRPFIAQRVSEQLGKVYEEWTARRPNSASDTDSESGPDLTDVNLHNEGAQFWACNPQTP